MQGGKLWEQIRSKEYLSVWINDTKSSVGGKDTKVL